MELDGVISRSLVLHKSINELDWHKSGNDLSLDLHKSGNELSLDLYKSGNDLSLDLHKSGDELSLNLHITSYKSGILHSFILMLC